MKKLLATFVATLLFTVWVGQVFADSCPYCGQQYGDYDPRDRARVMALRAQHEANCPMNPANRRGGGNYYQPNAPSGPSQWQLEERRRAEEEQRKRKEEAAYADKVAEANRRASEEARLKFENDKAEALNSLKGITGEELQIKGGTPFFGIKGNPDIVTLKAAGPATSTLPTAWKQLNAAATLARAAVAKIPQSDTDTRDADIEEVRYLCDQASKALAGERLNVVVPEAPDMPKRPTAPQPALTEFYRNTIRATEQQAIRIQKANKQIQQAEEKKKPIQAEIQVQQQTADRLTGEIENAEREKKKEKENARAEALGALARAKQAEADVDATEKLSRTEIKDGQDKLQQISRLSQQAQTDPDVASKLLTQLEALDANQTTKTKP